jgi:hypothetical protein
VGVVRSERLFDGNIQKIVARNPQDPHKSNGLHAKVGSREIEQHATRALNLQDPHKSNALHAKAGSCEIEQHALGARLLHQQTIEGVVERQIT